MPLTDTELQQLQEDGFLIVRDFFRPEQLAPVIEWVERLVDELANRLYDAGKVRNRYEGDGFDTRLTNLEREFPGAAVLLHTGGVLGQPLADLWGSKELLDVIQQILGPEVAGHPVWNIRSKTPNNPLLTVPWHQDTAYLAAGTERTLQPTAWIPLVDATGINGTLQVIRGGHASGKVFRHRPEQLRGHADSWYLVIDRADLPPGEVVTCEMAKGSMLLINQLIPHRSTENLADIIRWSVDLRWQRPGQQSGFEGIKDCILMRTAADARYRIDWSSWANQNRITDAMDQPRHGQFDTTVTGPWLKRWAAGS